MMDNNITVFFHEYYYHSQKGYLLSLDIPEYTFIGENMMSVKDWDVYDYYVKHHIHELGTHALIQGNLQYTDLQLAPMDKWWKSSECIPDNPFGSFLARRDWIMNEV